jgi:predicted MFS family arabinose efflux permease
VTYPLAGWVGATWGTQASFIALTIVAALSLLAAVLIWRPEHEAYAQIHRHTDSDTTHEHDFVIDDEHPSWPKKEK